MHTTSLELRSLDRTESKLNITGSNVINGIPPISSPEGHDKDFVDIFAVKPAREMDDYDVDFSDTRKFAVDRWSDISSSCNSELSALDQQTAAQYSSWESLAAEIQAKLSDPATPSNMKRQIARIQTFPQELSLLTKKFEKLVSPLYIRFDILWGTVYLSLKMSYTSTDLLKRTTLILSKVKRVAGLFVRCLDASEEDNDSRIAVVEFLDSLSDIFVESVQFFHACCLNPEASEQSLADLDANVTGHLSSLDDIVKYLSEITSFTKVNMERKHKHLKIKHSLVNDTDEPGTFPCRMLPVRETTRFYGRKRELDTIFEYVRPRPDGALRTYTIYGRRGVGKTEIALQFASTNPVDFDAIFWIQCETSIAIRQSFTEVAVALNLPSANRNGHHEENLLEVHDWLKRTKKSWLLIFDNAENDQILQGYWPVASGSILITSRSFKNFQKDSIRAGNTIKPFDSKGSWELLLEFLGDHWKKLERAEKIPVSEVIAAKALLKMLNGLPLAIQQAAVSIANPDIGGPTIGKTLEMLRDKIRTLPDRYSTPRSSWETSLDALWDMQFSALSRNARTLLGDFAWLSPDSIPVELFLPRDQGALEGPLAFCKQEPKHINQQNKASLYSLISTSPLFDKAVSELVARELLRRDGKVFSIHRVVQEAISFHNLQNLQDSFDSACKIVYEAFPKVKMNGTLFPQWSTCSMYIAHGVCLSKLFSDHTRFGKLRGSDSFVRLLANCGQYLLEIGDYTVCTRLIDTAISACDERKSLLYGELCNTSGNMYYELNRLKPCREAWQETLKVRLRLLRPTSPNHPGIAAIYNNLGNLELASGNIDEADSYFNKAVEFFIAGGDATAENLALAYLSVARLEMFRGELDKALDTTILSDSLFSRTGCSDKNFKAHFHYLSGNIQYRQKRYEFALRSYSECLKIGLATMPIHPIVIAAEYSLACVEFAMGRAENAQQLLDKARTIADLRSPSRDDGNIARILWKSAQVLESDTCNRYADEAVALRTRAELARAQITAMGEGGDIPFPNIESGARDFEEESYTALVPLFFR